MRARDVERIERKMGRAAGRIDALAQRIESPDPQYPCSICGTDAEAGVNVFTAAGETFSRVATVFEVSRSAAYRHRKHFADRILVDREGARKMMAEVQTFTVEWDPPVPVADMWRHLTHVEYPDLGVGQMPWGASMLALAGIEPHRSRFLEGLAAEK